MVFVGGGVHVQVGGGGAGGSSTSSGTDGGGWPNCYWVGCPSCPACYYFSYASCGCKPNCDPAECETCDDVNGVCVGCDPAECKTCVGGECKVCGGDPNQFCCDGACGDHDANESCCDNKTIYNFDTKHCCGYGNGKTCNNECEFCCNGNCCDRSNCEICKNETCVRAVPTNMCETYVEDMGNGVLHFEYEWDSTTGELNDLYLCEVREKVDYPGGNPYYLPSPPWNGYWTNPTLLPNPPMSAVYGEAEDNHSPPVFKKPYCNKTFCATQVYQYRCGSCTEWATLLSIGSICRYVTGEDSTWRYSIIKSGAYAEIFPLQ